MITLPNVTAIEISDPWPGLARSCELVEFGAVVRKDRLSSYEEYNRWTLQNLKDEFDTSHVIKIHHDGFVLNPAAWSDEFLQYDYIGAVIWNGEVGCGGFSMRSKRFCELTAQIDIETRNERLLAERSISPKDRPNEDFIVCVEHRAWLESQGMKFAPVEVADRYAWDRSIMRQPQYTGAFGFHSPNSLAWLKGNKIIE